MKFKSCVFAAAASMALLYGHAAAQTVLKLGHVFTPTDVHHQATELFAQDVEKATNGEVKVQIFSGSTLGTDRELIEGLKFGTADMWMGGSSGLSSVAETAKIFPMHFMISDMEHFKRVYSGPVGQEITNQIKKESGYQILTYWLRGPRWLATKTPVKSPQELAGKKIRVVDLPVYVKSLQAMGAAATPLSYAEIYMAAQQGVVSGLELPLSLILSSKFYEVVKYLGKTEHVYEPVVIAMSAQSLAKIPEKHRQAVIQAANGRAKQFADAEVVKGERTFLKALQDNGMVVVEVDKAPFRARIGTLMEKDFASLRPLYLKVAAEGGASSK